MTLAAFGSWLASHLMTWSYRYWDHPILQPTQDQHIFSRNKQEGESCVVNFLCFLLVQFPLHQFPVPKQTFLTYHPIPSSHIDFSLPAPNRVDIVRFGSKEALTALKHVYLVKRRLYIYRVRNFLSYPMWDITNTPHAALCPMKLRGQTDKHSLRD